ncbi:unnamed protein product [Linum tenue]|uniref:Late embryogenesis abundant protein LEA-2 subgroup domain-containing protein n=1 Tax=Linum tenue TaxID=586396 RepID=A0AAV0IN94_9ROSI|nr:unnamed protein product [Linum tenue]
MEPATGYPPPPPTSTSYPYQPPPQQPSNPYYYNPSNGQGPVYTPARPILYRRLITIFIAVTVVFFAALFISWILIRPRIPEFRLTSFTLSGFNSSSHQLSGTWAARLEVYNPNKKMDIENLTAMETRFSIVNTFVDQSVTDAVDEERRKHGSVGFDLEVAAGVGFKVGELRARRRLLKVSCDDLDVRLDGNGGGSGNLTGVPKRCDVYS